MFEAFSTRDGNNTYAMLLQIEPLENTENFNKINAYTLFLLVI